MLTQEERQQFIADIAAAIRIRNTDTNLTPEQVRWVELAIQKEAQSIEFRKAIIEKSLSVLFGAALVAIGSAIYVWFTTHIFKP